MSAEEEIMHRSRSLSLMVALFAVLSAAAPAILTAGGLTPLQEEGPGRGDDLARVQQWRSFLDPAFRAFTAARMSTTAVQAKISEADERIAELKDAQGDTDSENVGRSDITGDVGFLERAFRAFTAARMSTTDVKRWLDEAKEVAEGE